VTLAPQETVSPKIGKITFPRLYFFVRLQLEVQDFFYFYASMLCRLSALCPGARKQLQPYTPFTRSSKRPANVFKIHVLIARRLLEICWIV